MTKRLFTVTVSFNYGNVQHNVTGLWEAVSREEAIGFASENGRQRFGPLWSIVAQDAFDISDIARQWVAANPSPG